jgi:hypothetical protein
MITLRKTSLSAIGVRRSSDVYEFHNRQRSNNLVMWKTLFA